MQNAVIYARYSSERQNEQSIAGQVDACTKWAKDNDVNILTTYHDEALTGKTDKRPDFQKMIRDAKSGKFSYILVYKLDRFARNRYDSAMYKAQLKKYNVKVVSVMENIADGPEGIILESVLEGMAEYYSANLSQNVLRGMRQRAELGKHLGGTPPLGYVVDKEKNYVIDPNTAPVVKKIFEMYAGGSTLTEIASHINNMGYKTIHGRSFSAGSFYTILKNEKYIGTYRCFDMQIKNVIPKIIDDELFYKVQNKLEKNRKAPAASKGKVDFFLTGKLFCGKCGHNMVGDSGTSRTKTKYYYYSCIEKKRKHTCTKKSVQKDWIEDIITDVTINQVLTDENIHNIAQTAFEIYEKECKDESELATLKNLLKETQKIIDNIMSAIKQGIITPSTKEQLMEAEDNKKELLAAIAHEEIQKPKITQEEIEFFLHAMKNRIENSDNKTELIISTFVNAVYLYDDKITITYNLRDGESLKKLDFRLVDKFGFDNATCSRKKDLFQQVFFSAKFA